MKIYTKKGDKGETGLLGGVRVSKAALRVDTYGHSDELGSVLGVIRAQCNDSQLTELLGQLQLELFFLNAELATPEGKKLPREKIEEQDVLRLEREIDRCDEELPALKSFILPGGSPTAAMLQWARTVCRRAERSCVLLAQEESLRPVVSQYLNRLSDLLFALGRLANLRDGHEEILFSDLQAQRLQRTQAKE